MAFGAGNFLDSDTFSAENSNTQRTVQRPWRSYWPPSEGTDLYKWLESKHPQVLSWHFDSKNPFDRPWQAWTKQLSEPHQAHLLPSTGTDVPTKALQTVPPDAQPPTLQSPTPEENLHNYDPPLRCSHPENFSYLASLPRYDTEKPYQMRIPFLRNLPRTNVIKEAYPVTVADLHDFEDNFKLETSGFQYVLNPVPISQWSNEVAQEIYLPMMERWLLNHFKCKQVYIYTYTLRSKGPHTENIQWTSQFTRAHCGNLVPMVAILIRILDVTPNSSATVYGGLSMALSRTTHSHCDARTVSSTDLVAADVVFPHFCDELFEVRYSPNHRWFYKSGMSVDETIVFKLYDNSEIEASCKENPPPKFSFSLIVIVCAHAAFADPTVSPDAPPRESIEVRAIIIG